MRLNSLTRFNNPRRSFSPANIEDLKELKYFKEHGKWRSGCPFYLEDPYVEIPVMCDAKYTNFMLSKIK
jgi:hypothetical protein